jgi:hypothetical protein
VSVALRGSLRDFGIGEVFQLIGQQRKTGLLEVEGGGERFRVSFEEGAVVSAAPLGPYEHAALAELLVRTGMLAPDRLVALEPQADREDLRVLLVRRGGVASADLEDVEALLHRETLFRLMRLEHGSFDFMARPAAGTHARARRIPAEQILMDGLRMVDEWRTFDAEATSDTAVFQRTGAFERYREQARAEAPHVIASAEKIYLLVDGRLPNRRVIDLSRLGSFEGARLLCALRAAGVVEAVDPAALARNQQRRRSLALAPAPARAGVAAALPFVLLFAVAVLTLRAPAASPPEGAVALRRDGLREARVAHATRRARHLSEAHRLARGEWPAGPEELAQWRWLGAPALAPSGPGSYHWIRRTDGVLVLAPEP